MRIPLNWLNEIITLPKDTKFLTDKLTMVGHMLDKKLIVNDETVLDLELRGNRADCYSILGIAREISALFGIKIKEVGTLPITKTNKLPKSSLTVLTPLVKRATITEIYNIKLTESPKWLREKIIAYGMESINNIVDLTNYIMIELGQPMHAWDLDKVNRDMQIRLAKNKEVITTFQGQSLTLTADDLVWAMGKNVLAVAGGIGEKYHSVSESTKNIILEAANYDRASIRKTIYRHNLLTESGIRQEKELDPNLTELAIGRFLYFIKKYNWGEFNAKVYDYYPKKVGPWKIKLELSQLETLGGVKIETSEIKKILTNLNFKITKFDKNTLEVEVPTYRTDVILPEDLIEEILRIYGYDKVPTKTLSLEIPKPVTPDYITQEDKLRYAATTVAFNEVITLSFVKEDLSNLNLHPLASDTKVVSLINPPSPDNRDLRISLLPNLIELTKKAINEREVEVRLFELGKIYYKQSLAGKAGKNSYVESRKIAFSFYKEGKDSFSLFKSLIEAFFVKVGMEIPDFISATLLAPLINSYELALDKKVIGFGGRFENIYYLEIDLDNILTSSLKYSVKLWPKFPPQIEDITIEFPEKTYIGEAINSMKSVSQSINKVTLKDVFNSAYTFRIEYLDANKTLTDEDVKMVRTKILTSIKQKLGGVVKN